MFTNIQLNKSQLSQIDLASIALPPNPSFDANTKKVQFNQEPEFSSMIENNLLKNDIAPLLWQDLSEQNESTNRLSTETQKQQPKQNQYLYRHLFNSGNN
jgi:hypothetical protein